MVIPCKGPFDQPLMLRVEFKFYNSNFKIRMGIRGIGFLCSQIPDSSLDSYGFEGMGHSPCGMFLFFGVFSGRVYGGHDPPAETRAPRSEKGRVILGKSYGIPMA